MGLVMMKMRASISWYTSSEVMSFSCAGRAVPPVSPVPLWLFHLHWLPTTDSGIFFSGGHNQIHSYAGAYLARWHRCVPMLPLLFCP